MVKYLEVASTQSYRAAAINMPVRNLSDRQIP